MTPAPGLRRLPLDGVHRQAGCQEWVEEGGYRVPDHYGDPAAERRALVEDAILFDASAWGRVELLGRDARRLLNGFCTTDLQAIETGTWRYGLIPAQKGQILADAVITALKDRLWLRLPPGQGKPVRDHLSRFVLAEQVELLPMGDMIPLWILGPAADSDLAQAGVELPPLGGHRRLDLWGTEVQVEHGHLLGLEGVCLSASASIAAAFVEDLRIRMSLSWCGRRAVESVRIGAGAGRWGADFGPDTLPQEAGLDAAVDYQKGCYLGQEVIARLHYRGQEQRRLCAVEAEGVQPGVMLPGAPIRDESGGEVGTVTSVDPLGNGAQRGIALLRRSAFEEPLHLVLSTDVRLRSRGLIAADAQGLPDRA